MMRMATSSSRRVTPLSSLRLAGASDNGRLLFLAPICDSFEPPTFVGNGPTRLVIGDLRP